MNDLDALKNAIVNGRSDTAKALLEDNLQVLTYATFLQLLTDSMIEVGDRFKSGEFFIPEMLISAELTGELFELYCSVKPQEVKSKKLDSSITIIFGTVQGDIHTIGKDIIVKALYCCGIDIYDIGVNVTEEKFSAEIEKYNPDIVMMSAFTTATRRNLVKIFNSLKHDFPAVRFFTGGAAVNRKFAEELGADGYFENIIEIINYLKNYRHNQEGGTR